jgi:hypothetical protein
MVQSLQLNHSPVERFMVQILKPGIKLNHVSLQLNHSPVQRFMVQILKPGIKLNHVPVNGVCLVDYF